MYFFCQLCNYPLLTERAEPWKLVADTRVTGSKDLVASSSASGGNRWGLKIFENINFTISIVEFWSSLATTGFI